MGTVVGWRVGLGCVGPLVGCTDGDAEGRPLGHSVGESVGTAEGGRDGYKVGGHGGMFPKFLLAIDTRQDA